MSAGLTLSDDAIGPDEGQGAAPDSAAGARLRRLVDSHHDFVWRSLRRLGVPAGDVDDVAQRVFLTLARKLDSVRPDSERSFLFQTALREASDHRRTCRRRREDFVEDLVEDDVVDEAPGGEDLLDLRRARRVMDAILDAMPMDLRAVFVLCELDEVTMAETALLLDIPAGTVASRLRRARAAFRQKAAELMEPGSQGGAR